MGCFNSRQNQGSGQAAVPGQRGEPDRNGGGNKGGHNDDRNNYNGRESDPSRGLPDNLPYYSNAIKKKK